MSVFQEKVKGFKELPSFKQQLEEQKLKLASVEKIKNGVSVENYLALSSNYEKSIQELTSRIDLLQTGINELKSEIELDSKILESENSLLEKELQEFQFLSERGALSKQDYASKRKNLDNKISKNKDLLKNNQLCLDELIFYSTQVGSQSYSADTYGGQLESWISKVSFFKSRIFILIVSVFIILLIIKIFEQGDTIKIGEQVWMAKNLDVDHYRNGDPIPQVQDKEAWANLKSGAWCYYEYNSGNGKVYGKLYNWNAIIDSRGLAPEGWHIPSDIEWKILTDYLGGPQEAGGALKEIGTKHWRSPNNGASDKSKFKALPSGGYSNLLGEFDGIGSFGGWWSSTEINSDKSWVWIIENQSSGSVGYSSRKADGYSVRCLKN